MKISHVVLIFFISCNINKITSIDVMNNKNEKFFEVIVDHVEILKETPSIAEWHVKVRKVNKTRSLVGYMTLQQPLGNNIKIEFKCLKKQGGEYRYMPYTIPPTPFCEACSKDKYVYPDFAKNSDFPENIGEICPLPAGNYSLYGVTFDLSFAPKMAVQSGEYAVETIYFKDDEHYATYRVFGFVNKV